MSLDIPFDNSYGQLPERFFTRQPPQPVAAPKLIAVNDGLAVELGIDPDALRGAAGVAMLAGNAVPDGADPLAQVYAGHQFGGWNPQLGDGRALLLGEVIDAQGVRRDIQLKGSGRTPYSRAGDGRAWLGPVLREYLVSEAMHALGIPTTRALAAVETGQPVQRERLLPGAVLTRVASSHIRVGTFQYFAARQDREALQALTDHVIARHYPEAEGPLGLLDAVIARHAELIAAWMSVGFIHGVMNTDNSHVAGETIDYGPCAFMDTYHPGMVYSSIDHGGRYAYGRQPEIAVWNMAQLATSLLPLMGDDRDAAVEAATKSVHRFPDLYRAAWLRRFGANIGIAAPTEADQPLIEALLVLMQKNQADFTNTFFRLADGSAREEFVDPTAFDTWASEWRARLRQEDTPEATMRASNPAVIPRNHQIEAVIEAAVSGDYAPFFALHAALGTPLEAAAPFMAPPEADEIVHQTFCGT
jgi:uncharacterized protein YdiU (UPF0061 family)